MLDTFWSGVGQELARHWVARVLTPAFAFWAGGLALVWWQANAAEVAARGWAPALLASGAALGGLPVLAQGALVVGGLSLVAASAVVAERLTFPLLRLLEGYWTRPRWLHRWLVGRRRRRFEMVWNRTKALELRRRRRQRRPLTEAEEDELQTLRTRPVPQRTDEDRARLQQLGKRAALTAQERSQLGRDLEWLLTTPSEDSLRMPTRLGDILRAAEHTPADRYGIDAVACWSALWLLLPAETRTELTQARAAMDAAVRSWLWGGLFLVWTPYSWWALLVGVVLPLLSYHFGILPRGVGFGQLLVTSFDLHRMKLYDALHLPRAASPEDERAAAGPRLTRALSQRLVEHGLTYRFDSPTPDAEGSGS